MESPDKLLIRATNWVGDAVMSLPALRALRDHYPNAHIAVLALPWVADLYGREPFCDEVVAYPAGRGMRARASGRSLPHAEARVRSSRARTPA